MSLPNFEPLGDTALEARIVSWVLGDASAFEAAELERLCEERPELLVFRRRMRALHNLLTEAEAVLPDDGWKLPPAKRRALDAIFGDPTPLPAPPPRKLHPVRRGRQALLAIAACLTLTAAILGLLAPVGLKSARTPVMAMREMDMKADLSAEAASPYNALALEDRGLAMESAPVTQSLAALSEKSMRFESAPIDSLPAEFELLAKKGQSEPQPESQARVAGIISGGNHSGDGAIERHSIDAILSNPNRNNVDAIPPPTDGQLAQNSPGEATRFYRSETGADESQALVERRPSAPSSSMANVIAANSAAPTAIPVPAEGSSPSVDFGDGDDFGAGWGSTAPAPPPAAAVPRTAEKPAAELTVTREFAHPTEYEPPIPNATTRSNSTIVSGLAQRELLRRQLAVAEGETKHLEGREAYEKGDYTTAAKELDEALDQVPDASVFDDRRAAIASDLANANVALSYEARRVGKYDEARESLAKALIMDPNNQAAKDALAHLDDPIRTNPALTYEHTKNVDEIRRNLYTAEGHFNLGKFDDAKTQYEEVLRTDPYNSAARRGLERIAAAKSDDYRAAYDHTRAELLMEVDGSWELSIPGEKSFDFSNELKTAEDPFSTFSLHISDASFRQAQAALDKGERPDPASIRVEQFYNAIDCGDPSPSNNEPVAARIEQSAHPIIPGRNLVRLAVKTAAAGRSAAQPLRLTLLIDESGSMAREDRRAAMQSALTQLATLLTVDDRISVIGFSRTPRLLADSLPGNQAHTLPDLVNLAASEAGTNLEEALRLAANIATRQLTPGAQNRIVLFTDGAANLGNADPARLAKRITTLRQQGIAFDAAGISATDLNDQLLSELTRHGNGRYQVIDGGDAGGRFAKQLAGAFRPAAENVKVQVRFNPERVASHRLAGFEEHRLNTEDFRNDTVDAAELAAEEAGVALYQIQTLPQGRGEIGEMSVRFLDTATGTMVERSWTIPYDPATPAFDQSTPSLQLTGLALLVAEKLKSGPLADAINLRDLTQVRATLKTHYAQSPQAQQLLKMADQVQ